MSYFDHSMHSYFTVSGYKTIAQELAGGLRSMTATARGAAQAEANDDDFCPRHLKADRLPSIETCQTTIFRELRHREEAANHEVASPSTPRDRKLFGIKDRIGQMFATTVEVMH